MEKKKIMIVDDDASTREVLSARITSAGYGAQTASNGREAIGLYIESLHNKEPLSLILLDIKMPGLDGIEVLGIIRDEENLRKIQNKNRTPIIMLTGFDSPWMEPSLVKDCDDYVEKPYNPEELLKKIKEKLAPVAQIG